MAAATWGAAAEVTTMVGAEVCIAVGGNRQAGQSFEAASVGGLFFDHC
jgi:hypothetical protein